MGLFNEIKISFFYYYLMFVFCNDLVDVCSHLLVPVCTDDVPGPVLNALHSNVLGRLPGSDDQYLFSAEFPGISEIMSVHDAARECVLEN